MDERPKFGSFLIDGANIFNTGTKRSDDGIGPIKFDIAWNGEPRNLIHPISFDLQESVSIQKKTAEYCGYLDWLDVYTKNNNSRIDFLLGEPQDSKLKRDYEQAINLLNNNPTRKKVVPFNEIDQYAEEVARAVC